MAFSSNGRWLTSAVRTKPYAVEVKSDRSLSVIAWHQPIKTVAVTVATHFLAPSCKDSSSPFRPDEDGLAFGDK